ncbi:GNAT family N-acetyltransferase [Candidatus Enterococcus ferrettii]|uniref:N-acetyltransferase domain-containing protein n=1 Tax=Candidatus Enterococcus ferrettii TaxID=2815324 RepID=A0ABV0EPK5_9ENTE|nr:GNAT family N-acetyltransferase [Enterococcus sp. 665A]MBO1338887.1 GNAT family N-acetyltransferase [Enterococcus sp. 665A]
MKVKIQLEDQNTLEFRKAKRLETIPICQLVQQTIQTIYPKYYPKEITTFFSNMHSEKRIYQDISEENLWVLIDGTDLLGTCTYIENVVMRLFVKPEFQCRGYGKLILDCVEKNILQKHDQVILEAVVSAARMYEKRGYKTLNHEKLVISESAILTYEVMQLNKTK